MHSDYNKRVAKNYAQVLFDLSMKKKTIDRLLHAFSTILQELKTHKFLEHIFKNPLLSKEDQATILANFSDGSVASFFSFIIQKKRLPIIDLIAESFIDLVAIHKNQGRALLETAHPLTKDQKDTLRQKFQSLLKFKDLTLEEHINPRLLGGFRLKIRGKIFDASLVTQTQNILKESHV